MMAAAVRVLGLGIVSTLSMDVLTGVAIGLKLIAPLPPHLVGRWFASVARAQPFHADIARASPVSHEMLIALPVHYAIGITLTTLFVASTGRMGWSRAPGVALVFGLCTCVLPWLLMFPAMGYGLFGSQRSRRDKTFSQQPGVSRVLRPGPVDRRLFREVNAAGCISFASRHPSAT